MDWPAVRCPRCVAEAGEPCLNGRDKPMRRCHPERREEEAKLLVEQKRLAEVRHDLRALTDEEFGVVQEAAQMASIEAALGMGSARSLEGRLVRIIVRLARRLAEV